MLAKPAHVKSGLFKKFRPDYIVNSVTDIDFNYLAKHGVKAALIDLDGTVVNRGTYEVSAKLSQSLSSLPFKLYIATNRPKSRDLKDLRDQLHAAGVIHPIGLMGKPFPRYYAQAAADHGLRPQEVVMIGDRYLQDIYGANLAGMRTVLVRKIDKPIGVVDDILSGIERKQTDRLARSYVQLD